MDRYTKPNKTADTGKTKKRIKHEIMKARFILHVEHEDMGSFEHVLHNHGIMAEIVYAPCCDISALDPHDGDILVLMGGPMSVNDAPDIPWLAHEIELVKQRIAANLPILGICLGSQIIAKALGAEIHTGPQGKEIGWMPIQVNEAGLNTPLRHLDGDHTSMFHWHGDTFDVPQGATLLASSPLYRNQAYAYGDNVLALQCHPEITEAKLERWYKKGEAQLIEVGKNVQDMRLNAQAFGPRLQAQNHAFFEEWLRAVAPQFFAQKMEMA